MDYIILSTTNQGSLSTYSVLVASESALSELPSDVPIGSIAYTAGFTHIWQKGLDENWTSI